MHKVTYLDIHIFWVYKNQSVLQASLLPLLQVVSTCRILVCIFKNSLISLLWMGGQTLEFNNVKRAWGAACQQTDSWSQPLTPPHLPSASAASLQREDDTLTFLFTHRQLKDWKLRDRKSCGLSDFFCCMNAKMNFQKTNYVFPVF